jgi:hypothetical protein
VSSGDSLTELTATLEVEELGTGRAAPTVELPDDIAAVSREFAARGWSDGLPIVPPTEERVAAMLAGTPRDPLEVIGILPPRRGEATVHAVAVNAVMAGCVPEHMPVLIAAVRAVSHPEFNLSGVNATTHPVSQFLLVSGPIAADLGIHSGSGCFGPGFPANATLGRALRLIELTLAGAWPGRGDRSTQATPAKIAFCAAENLEASPWAPFHTTRGFESDQDAVTVFGTEGPHNIQDHGSNTALGIMRTIVASMSQGGSNNILARGSPVLVFGPEHAATVAAEGWTREDVQSYIFENARYPLAEMSDEFFEVVQEHTQQGVPVPLFERDALAPIADGPEHIHVIVAGGPGKHSSWLPTFGNMTRPVTVPVD